jgi:hypothetical protein
MRSRNHGILGLALSGGIDLELTYRPLASSSCRQPDNGTQVPAYGETDNFALDVAFLLSRN